VTDRAHVIERADGEARAAGLDPVRAREGPHRQAEQEHDQAGNQHRRGQQAGEGEAASAGDLA
jgi:hypothetical protein